MYQLYIANKNYSSWSLRPWCLMTQLGIAFEENLVVFDGVNNWDTFRQFSPSGTVPCLADGDLTVWDSLAIVEYLAESHPQVWPDDAAARSWARSACAEMHGGFFALREYCSMNIGIRVALHQIPDKLARDLDRVCELWQSGLETYAGSFLCGKNFTAVDAFFAPVVFRLQTYQLDVPPLIKTYMRTMLTSPSLAQWQADALKETWRDEAHEAEIIEYGNIVKDLRAMS